jgi:hypothetical protein
MGWDRASLEETMLRLAAARAPGRSLDPTEVARALAGPDPQAWSRLMPELRRTAVQLMEEGRLVITRKGRPVDPRDFRGTYRLSLPPVDASTGPGNSSSMRPARR